MDHLAQDRNQTTIALFGIEGSGKSYVGNGILGRTQPSEYIFPSKKGENSSVSAFPAVVEYGDTLQLFAFRCSKEVFKKRMAQYHEDLTKQGINLSSCPDPGSNCDDVPSLKPLPYNNELEIQNFLQGKSSSVDEELAIDHVVIKDPRCPPNLRIADIIGYDFSYEYRLSKIESLLCQAHIIFFVKS